MTNYHIPNYLLSYRSYLFPTEKRKNTLIFFISKPVYKQLAFGWQIAMQLSGLNLLSLSNNKNYRLKKSGVFPLKQT